MKQHKRTYM